MGETDAVVVDAVVVDAKGRKKRKRKTQIERKNRWLAGWKPT